MSLKWALFVPLNRRLNALSINNFNLFDSWTSTVCVFLSEKNRWTFKCRLVFQASTFFSAKIELFAASNGFLPSSGPFPKINWTFIDIHRIHIDAFNAECFYFLSLFVQFLCLSFAAIFRWLCLSLVCFELVLNHRKMMETF